MPATDRVKQALEQCDLDCKIRHLDESAHTALQAAMAVRCDVAQIVKSLIFKTTVTGTPVLALVSGDNRLDTAKLSAITGSELGKASADFVKQSTGFTIGGVAPVGSLTQMPVYMDRNLMKHETVWAAAGHPKTVFEISPSDLASVSGAIIANLV